MLTRRILSALTLVTLGVSLPCAHAAEKWVGKATNMEGTFNYGTVTFTVSGNTMKNLKIEAVITSGCGGYKNVLVPTLKIRGTKFTGAYVPVPGLDDIVTVYGTIRGGKATGTFFEGPLCSNAGRFTAKRK